MTRPSPVDLWRQAGGGTPTYSADEYRRLLREHGLLVDGPAEPLPCGWTPGKRAAQWPDQPASADTAVEQLEVHHARGKERTDAEQAALKARAVACAGPGDLQRAADKVRPDLTRVKLSDGYVDVPPEVRQFFGDEFFARLNGVRQPSGGACCQAAYDSDGFAHDHEVVR